MGLKQIIKKLIGRNKALLAWDEKNERIKSVYVFDSGMCAVFDYQGEQIAPLQGVWEKKKQAILARIDSDTKIRNSLD
ncbi:MAG: hypothetical protein ACFFDT_00190 [Candidatus Hodarchaeota archaeon]